MFENTRPHFGYQQLGSRFKTDASSSGRILRVSDQVSQIAASGGFGLVRDATSAPAEATDKTKQQGERYSVIWLNDWRNLEKSVH